MFPFDDVIMLDEFPCDHMLNFVVVTFYFLISQVNYESQFEPYVVVPVAKMPPYVEVLFDRMADKDLQISTLYKMG